MLHMLHMVHVTVCSLIILRLLDSIRAKFCCGIFPGPWATQGQAADMSPWFSP